MHTKDGSIERRRVLQYIGSAAAASALAGCTGDEPEDGDQQPTGTDGGDDSPGETTPTDDDDTTPEGDTSLTMTLSTMPLTLDPHDHSEIPTEITVTQAYERPIKFDREQTVVGELVEEWNRVDDTRVRFEVRDGVTFHNGDELTPGDVAYSINRIVDENVGITSRQAREINASLAEIVDGGVEVISESPNPIIFRQLAAVVTIVQRDWIESNGTSEIAETMNGTGPFQLESYEEDVEVTFTRFDDYWGELPEASELIINASSERSTRVSRLIAGETHIIESVSPEDVTQIRDSGNAVNATPTNREMFGVMRTDVEPFDDVNFRRAMNYAVNVEEIIEELLNGFAEPLSQPVFEGVVGYNPSLEPYPYDPDQAAELVEESGYAGTELELQTPVGRVMKDVEVAQTVASYIDDLPNVSCEVNQRDFAALISEVVDGNQETLPEFYQLTWGNSGWDSHHTFIPHFTSFTEPKAYQDDQTDELFQEAQTETDMDRRNQLLQDANERVRDQAGWMFLYRLYHIYGVSDRIQWEPRADELIYAKDVSFN